MHTLTHADPNNAANGRCDQTAPGCPLVSMIVIGRNEGERLERCLASIRALDYPAEQIELIYVDSNSSDGSCEAARRAGAAVIPITSGPYSAARARNLGWRAARGEYLHFVDGDTVLDRHWLRKAVAKLQEPGIGCVFGICEEIRPRASIYMRACNLDWKVPAGPWRTCGGIALFRKDVITSLNGFSEEMVAGEEPELCYRLRRLGLLVWRLDDPMVLHDLDMTRFAQYWRRTVRSGWAYCVVASRCCRGPERLWIRENLTNAVELGFWLLCILAAVATWSPRVAALAGLLLLARMAWLCVKARRRADGWVSAALYALHCQFSRIPFFIGQVRGLCFLLTTSAAGAVLAGHAPLRHRRDE